jgi:hypothetical protein
MWFNAIEVCFQINLIESFSNFSKLFENIFEKFFQQIVKLWLANTAFNRVDKLQQLVRKKFKLTKVFI